MGRDQMTKLGGRLREIGFSDRAVAMIVEQVQLIEDETGSDAGLREQAVAYDAVVDDAASATPPGFDDERRFMVIAGGVVSVLALILGLWGMTNPSGGELAIMAGPNDSQWPVMLLASLLVGWLVAWPLAAAWYRKAGQLADRPMLAVWAGTGLAVATLLVTAVS